MNDSTETKKEGRGRKPNQSVDEQIKKAEDELKRLKALKAQKEKQEREKNQKEVLDLLKSAGLDDVPASSWASAMPAIKDALLKKSKGTQDSKKEGGNAAAPVASDPHKTATGTTV